MTQFTITIPSWLIGATLGILVAGADPDSWGLRSAKRLVRPSGFEVRGFSGGPGSHPQFHLS